MKRGIYSGSEIWWLEEVNRSLLGSASSQYFILVNSQEHYLIVQDIPFGKT